MFRSIDKEGWSDDSMLRVSSQANQSNLYNNINPSSLHHSLVGRSSSGYSLNSTPSAGLTSSMSSPSLQTLGQSRQTSQLYGGTSNGTNLSTSALSTGRLNQFSSGLQSNNSSNLGLNNTRGQLNQASNLTNGFLGHQTNQTSNLNSKFSSGLGNNISSSFGSNSLSSNFGNNLMNIFGSGSTSPATSASTQGSSHLFGPSSGSNNVQGSSSHLFGAAGLATNSTPFTSQFNSISNNNNYSSFGGVSGAFSPSLDMPNSTGTEPLDLSEFPSLQAPAKQLSSLRLDTGNGLSGMPNNVSAFNMNSNVFPKNVTGNKTYSEVSNTNLTGLAKQENSPGFQISHEDFPALPGAPKQAHVMSHPVMGNEMMAQITPSPPEMKPGSMLMQVVTKPTKASIILPTFPPSMCKDQFGMAGLLAFIRSKDSCPNLIKFALGMDLCDLGLNLQSKGNLHSTFQSPWADRPCGLHHLEQNVPPEYRKLHARLNVSYMTQRIKKYGDDLLFWLYYNNIGTTIQLLAIQELKNRGWMYYIPEKIWITKALGKEAPKGPYGVYCWFDVANWRKSEREINFEPDKVEYCEQTKPHFGL